MLVPMCGLDGGKTSSGGGDAVRAVVAADSFDPKRKLRGDGGGSGGGLQWLHAVYEGQARLSHIEAQQQLHNLGIDIHAVLDGAALGALRARAVHNGRWAAVWASPGLPPRRTPGAP